MTTPRDGWDSDERNALDGFEEELAELRARHASDPSIELLRAADADALPEELQAEVTDHLRKSAWSRALVEGLREARPDDGLDAASEQRLFERIQRESGAGSATARGRQWAIAGLAIAATVLIAVMVTRRPEMTATPEMAAAPDIPTTAAPARPPEPAPIPVSRPEVKLSAAVLTWRGNASQNPLLRDLGPAFESYRAGDYGRASAAFDKLAAVYPNVIDVLFYQGVSHLLAGDAQGAIAPLSAAGRLADATFADDAAWFLAVAQQRSGQDARARFSALCRAGRAYSSEACNAVAQLDAAPR